MSAVPPAAPGPSAKPAPAKHLGTRHILVLIVAAAAPLSAMVGTVPLAIAFGTGAGAPAAFVFVGVTLLCFSVGFAVSARRTGGVGGFYASAADGLGRPPAAATGYLALLSYNCATFGLVGALGYFTHLVLADHGVDVPWLWCAAAGLALVAVLGYREIGLSAGLLMLLMLGEVGILLALDVAILVRDGGDALPTASFSPSIAVGPGLGVTLAFAFVSFIGFESAALYGKEAKDPRRSVPHATYAAVVVIAGFYALTSWIAVGAVGSGKVRGVATEQLGDFFFHLGDRYLGSVGATALQILLCTSLLAACLALHCAANRYIQTLAADGLLPARLSTLHPRHGSPHRASVVQNVMTAVIVCAFAVAGLDPYVDLTTSMLGLGTVGIIALQAVAAASVLGLRLRGGGTHWWREGLAPLLGFAGLLVSVWLVIRNFDMITGKPGTLVAQLPWLVPVVALAGLAHAAWLKSARPDRYRTLGLPKQAPEPASRVVTAHLAPTPGAIDPTPGPSGSSVRS
ncbi:APC family permease [Streptomyces sp. NPDC005576]|uniref:APC family permease n=1 Tax=unclassified Streptomyces TaxID=2593676 RepID=UPI0033C50602